MTSEQNITKSRMYLVSLFLLALLATVFIGYLDYITGSEISFSIFYLLPIIFATWFLGKKAGFLFSFTSAGMWLLADILLQTSNEHTLIPYWNALMRMGIFLIISVLLSRLKQIDMELEEKVQVRNGSLRLTIAERNKAQESLQASEKEYRNLVENAMVGIYKTSLDGKILYANKALAEMLELNSPEEMISSSVLSFYNNPIDRTSLIEKLIDKGEVANFEFEVLTKNNKIKNMLLSAALDGNIISGMMRDVSEKKMMEQQLIEAQKLEGIGTLASGIAHDFNNILCIIIGHAALLQAKVDLVKFKQSIDAINKVAARGAGLVNQLLTFACKSETVLVPVQINDIVMELTSLLKETFPKTIVVSSDLNENLPVVSADQNQVYQVLLNLCLNARDAMHDNGTLRISTTLEPVSAISGKSFKIISDEYMKIEVTDTGIGMDAETQRRAFEPFFTTKGIGKGTGLGLAVAFGIMQNHRGFIDLKSTPGVGSSFSLYFPVASCIRDDSESAKEDLDIALIGKETILFIEDEQLLRTCIKTCLEEAGYRIFEADDGKQAVEIYQKHQKEIDLVIADMGLPKMNGLEVYEHLRKVNPSLKCIVVSGYLEADQKSEIYQSGVIKIMQKPYLPKEILKQIRVTLDTK